MIFQSKNESHPILSGVDLLRVHPDHDLDLKLNELIGKLLTEKIYPKACRIAAASMELMGLEVVHDGWFQLDIPTKTGQSMVVHSWGYDHDRRIIELTGPQFNDKLFLENRFPSGIVIIPPEHPIYKRYET